MFQFLLTIGETLPCFCGLDQDMAEELFQVEKITDKRRQKGGHLEYLVKWEGYSAAHNTWEPVASFVDLGTIEEYEANLLREARAARRALGARKALGERAGNVQSSLPRALACLKDENGAGKRDAAPSTLGVRRQKAKKGGQAGENSSGSSSSSSSSSSSTEKTPVLLKPPVTSLSWMAATDRAFGMLVEAVGQQDGVARCEAVCRSWRDGSRRIGRRALVFRRQTPSTGGVGDMVQRLCGGAIDSSTNALDEADKVKRDEAAASVVVGLLKRYAGLGQEAAAKHHKDNEEGDKQKDKQVDKQGNKQGDKQGEQEQEDGNEDGNEDMNEDMVDSGPVVRGRHRLRSLVFDGFGRREPWVDPADGKSCQIHPNALTLVLLALLEDPGLAPDLEQIDTGDAVSCSFVRILLESARPSLSVNPPMPPALTALLRMYRVYRGRREMPLALRWVTAEEAAAAVAAADGGGSCSRGGCGGGGDCAGSGESSSSTRRVLGVRTPRGSLFHIHGGSAADAGEEEEEEEAEEWVMDPFNKVLTLYDGYPAPKGGEEEAVVIVHEAGDLHELLMSNEL